MYINGKLKDNWCGHCRVLKEFCFCDKIPSIHNSMHLLVIMQIRESLLASNSGHLAHYCLKNSEIRIRGEQDSPLDLSDLDFEQNHYLYLFPSDESVELTPSLIQTTDKKPVLVVPDGSWRACKKIRQRDPNLRRMTQIHLPVTEKSCYYLRRSHLEHGLSTLEAIAKSYGIVESKDTEQQMLQVFKIMVNIHLKQRQKNIPVSN